MKTTAVIVAAGSGTRMKADRNKVFLPLCGKPVLAYTTAVFEHHPAVDEIILVTRACDIQLCEDLKTPKVCAVIEGGRTRQESVYRGICRAHGDIVIIHDGARPFIEKQLITRVIEDCVEFGAAAVGVRCKDTLKYVDENGMITATLDREKTYQIQTPQVFLKETILWAHCRALKDMVTVTDDCALLEYYGKPVKITDGSYDNIKLTTPEDLFIGERILTGRAEL